ncbi:MAG: SDR family oxidoreductase [Candidatus Omnitrophica bacterium]|nr:SDR family oxidoreductase [Candidatus Omnitrophota bacterium]
MRNIFMTGAGGFIGSELIDVMRKSGESFHIYALVRGSRKIKGPDITLCDGDITKSNLGLNKENFDMLTKTVDTIFHCAADTDLNLSKERLCLTNVTGTKNVLDLALKCKEKGGLKKVNHISTAYVAGARGSVKCVVKEDELDVGQGFNNRYEESKSAAEKCVADYRSKGLDIDIFRPSIVLGRYEDGKTTNFKMLYQPIHFFSLELFDRLPAPVYDVANLINLDTAAKSIFLISNRPGKKNMNYHITSPNTVSIEKVLDIVCGYLGVKKPELVPAGSFDAQKEYTPVMRRMIAPYAAYFNYGAKFDMTNTFSALEGADLDFPDFDEENFTRLLKYCEKTGFIKRKKHAVIR